MYKWAPIILGVALLSGCSSKTAEEIVDLEDSVEIRLDKGESQPLIAFYLGGFLQKGDSLASIAVQLGSKWYLIKPKPSTSPDLQALFDAAGEDKILQWEEFEPVVRSSYYRVRNTPLTVDSLKALFGDWNVPGWFSYETRGQMTEYRRRLFIKRENIKWSLEQLDSPSDAILYDEGTAIIGEHLDQGQIIETTAMIKRWDGYWDYIAYGKNGQLALSVAKSEDPLLVPTQCIGCHYGNRAFEPERSFPRDARPGPSGERAVYVPEFWKNQSLTSSINEHVKRSDHVLGLYATLFLAEIITRSKKGEATAAELKLIDQLGID
ncbi:MAG: hypothetical protein O3B41_02520 [Bacteroidetes bacterium]|nr:hypothetical protein [Bacteroidota bacterium]